MKRILIFFILVLQLLLLSSLSICQTTSVTLQVTDTPDNQTWNNGTWQAVLQPLTGNITNTTFKIIGTDAPVPNISQSGALSGTGSTNIILTPTTVINPIGSSWNITVCSQATSPCYNQNVYVFGTTQTITITPPSIRIGADIKSSLVLAYTDLEVTTGIGQIYFNLTLNAHRVCNNVICSGGVGYTSLVGSGGSTPGGLPTQLQFNNGGVFGGLTSGPVGTPVISQGPIISPIFQSGITYASAITNWNRSFTSGSPLIGCPTGISCPSAQTITLSPCPIGVDYSTQLYQIWLTDTVEVGTDEAVNIISGSSSSGNCSVTFIPFFSHTSYTASSATNGVQEGYNIACGTMSTPFWNSQCHVIIPSNGYFPGSGSLWQYNNYTFNGTLFVHSNQSVLDGSGVSINCQTRGPCMQVGSTASSGSNHSYYTQGNTIKGFSFRSPVDYSGNACYAGVNITNTVTNSSISTITTNVAHTCRPGDIVTIAFTDNNAYWGDAQILTVPTSTTFTILGSGNIASQATPGLVALSYVAVLDNGFNINFQDINYDLGGNVGHFNNFFDIWDDENCLISHFNNNSISLNASSTWSGVYIYSGGAHVTQQIAPVITIYHASITANFSSAVTVYNSNGLYIDDSIIQSTGLWEVNSGNERGNYQGATIKDLYSNGSNNGINPGPPAQARTPFPGLGGAGLIAGPSTGVSTYSIKGNGGLTGYFPTGGTGATLLSYYIVANDWTGATCGTGIHTQTYPMQILNWSYTAGDNPIVNFPRVADVAHSICYDVLRMATPTGAGFPPGVYPYVGGCTGGSLTACGSVATNLPQCSGLICTYTDTGVPNTSSYTINEGNYIGSINFWPGSLVIVNAPAYAGIVVDKEQFPVVAIGTGGNPAQVSAQCNAFGSTSSGGGYTSCIGSQSPANNSVKNQTATLLADGADNSGGGMTLSKGRLNFTQSPYSNLEPHHIITLVDSQPGLTRSTNTYRPPASSNDVYIGTDIAPGGVSFNLGMLSFGAPVAITRYIGQTGDGTTQNWLERLTPAAETFKILVNFNNNFDMSGALLGQVPCRNATNFVSCYQGVVVDTESGASVTVQGDGSVTPFSNRATLINLTNNTTSTAVSLAGAGTTGFTTNFVFKICDSGTVDATITATSNVNGVSTLILKAKPSGGTPSCATFWSNNSTWIADLVPGLPANAQIALVIASGTATMPTGSLSSNTCATATTVSATGVISTDSIKWSYNVAPNTSTSLLTVTSYPTTNNVNFTQCNPTSGAQVPAASTINWEVVR